MRTPSVPRPGSRPGPCSTGEQERAAWGLGVSPPDALVQSMNDARIHMVKKAEDVESAKSALQALPSELIATLQLDAALAAKLVAHDAAAAQSLLTLIIAFQKAGFFSVLPLFTSDNRVLLVLAVTALPGDATLLTARSKNSFRWYLMSLSGQPGQLERKIGSRNGWIAGSGLSAVVVVVAGKRGSTDPRGRVDPLEFRVALPDGALVNLEQYEFLMNLLDRIRPLGVIVDTRGIRDQIDADGNGAAETLSPSLSRTFRPYHQPRHVGVEGADKTGPQEGAMADTNSRTDIRNAGQDSRRRNPLEIACVNGLQATDPNGGYNFKRTFQHRRLDRRRKLGPGGEDPRGGRHQRAATQDRGGPRRARRQRAPRLYLCRDAAGAAEYLPE